MRLYERLKLIEPVKRLGKDSLEDGRLHSRSVEHDNIEIGKGLLNEYEKYGLLKNSPCIKFSGSPFLFQFYSCFKKSLMFRFCYKIEGLQNEKHR